MLTYDVLPRRGEINEARCCAFASSMCFDLSKERSLEEFTTALRSWSNIMDAEDVEPRRPPGS